MVKDIVRKGGNAVNFDTDSIGHAIGKPLDTLMSGVTGKNKHETERFRLQAKNNLHLEILGQGGAVAIEALKILSDMQKAKREEAEWAFKIKDSDNNVAKSHDNVQNVQQQEETKRFQIHKEIIAEEKKFQIAMSQLALAHKQNDVNQTEDLLKIAEYQKILDDYRKGIITPQEAENLIKALK